LALKEKTANKKTGKEDKEEQDNLRVMALDRSFKDILSTSPLKKRADYDLYGTDGMSQEDMDR
jgi:hypothetical protein